MNKNPFKGKSIFDIVDKEDEKEEAPKRENPFKGRSVSDIDSEDNKEIIETKAETKEEALEVKETKEEEPKVKDNPFKGRSIFDNSDTKEVEEEPLVEEDTSSDDITNETLEYEEEVEEVLEETPLEEKEVSNPFKGKSIFDIENEEEQEDSTTLEEDSFEENLEEEQEEVLEEVQEEVSEESEADEEENVSLDEVEESQEQEETLESEEVDIKFVLITGAYGGLGRVAMEECLKLGYAVFALDNNIDEDYLNDSVMPIQCDVSNERSIYQAYNTISEYTENLKAIINCAGVFYFDTMVEGSEEKLRKIIDINFYGTYRINQIFLPFLEKGGKIINVTSEVAEYSPQPFMGCYTISKKMVDCYSDVLRRELNYVGIKVVKIQAGSFRTGLFDKVNTEYERMYNNTEVYKKQLKKLKYMMDRELHKQHNPIHFGKVIKKILKRKHPKICYRVCRSRSLKSLNRLPEKWQDRIYKRVIK